MCKNDSTMNEAWPRRRAITMRDSWPCRRRDASVGRRRTPRARAFVRETRKVKQGEGGSALDCRKALAEEGRERVRPFGGREAVWRELSPSCLFHTRSWLADTAARKRESGARCVLTLGEIKAERIQENQMHVAYNAGL